LRSHYFGTYGQTYVRTDGQVQRYMLPTLLGHKNQHYVNISLTDQ
jgi:hypothetical protein